MSTPKISVIVPVYNVEKWLRRCVDSILAQTFTDFELLLVDDGSTDASGAICDEYAQRDSRVRVFHKPNGGVSSARNLGLNNAKGEWISFVDADDWVATDAFEVISNTACKSETDIVSFGFWSVKKDDKKPILLPSIESGKDNFIRQLLLHSWGWTVVWNSFFSSSLLSKYGLLFKEGIVIGEDFDFLFRAYYYAKGIKVIDAPLYFYNRMNEYSALHTLSVKQYDDIIYANLSIIAFFKEKGVFEQFKDIMAWRVLRAKQDFVLDIDTHEKFLSIYPECHDYILSCSTINKKIKIMMWLLTHHLGWMTRMIVRVRNRIRCNK